MNYIAIIILTTLVVETILNITADVLNLRMVKNEVPEDFQDVYDAERYRRSQEYLKVNTRFEWFTSAFDIAVMLSFWFLKGFPLLDGWARSWNKGPIITGLIYMGVLLLVRVILTLPFNVYSTFVIEERFGFNKTSLKTFVTDRIKGLVLAILIGGPLLAAILAFFEYVGSFAWLYCWGFLTVFMLAMQYIAPTWIMPLFNKFTPLEAGELKSSILSYADKVNFPLQNVYVMDGSKRSAKSNAFFTGFGKNKRIALFDTLIAQHTVSELIGILAHEIGHYKKKHILKGIVIAIVHSGVVFYLLSLFISTKSLFDAFYMTHTSVYAGMLFFGMLLSPIDFFLGLLMHKFSRKNEYEADRFAVDTTGDRVSLAKAIKKLSAHNLSNLMPHPFYVFLNYSHPPVRGRIKAMLKF